MVLHISLCCSLAVIVLVVVWRCFCRSVVMVLLSGAGAGCSLGLLLCCCSVRVRMLPLSVVDFSGTMDRPTSASPHRLPLSSHSQCCPALSSASQSCLSVLSWVGRLSPAQCCPSHLHLRVLSHGPSAVMLPSDADPSCLPVLSHALQPLRLLSALVYSMCSRC
jgi:hypothetical protein